MAPLFSNRRARNGNYAGAADAKLSTGELTWTGTKKRRQRAMFDLAVVIRELEMGPA